MPGFSRELANLRERMDRDVWSHFLRAPELKQSPLADQPLDTAIDNFCRKLASDGEWRRLYEILKAQRRIAPTSEKIPKKKDAITSIRDFLAGQNLEMAEEWRDAAAAYKSVVQINLDRTPVKQAADRLKSLEKEHPEVSRVSRNR